MTRPISTIAKEIRAEWGVKVNFAAVPYLTAMCNLNTITDWYGADSARTIISYFLSNASTFRGNKAKTLKAELKQMLTKKTVTFKD